MKRRTFFGTVAAAAVGGLASTVKAEASSGKRNLERTMEELTEGKTTLKLNGDPGKDTVIFCMRTWTESPTETPPIKTVWVGHAADTERFIAMANASTRVKSGPQVSTTLTVVDQHRRERVYGMWRGREIRVEGRAGLAGEPLVLESEPLSTLEESRV